MSSALLNEIAGLIGLDVVSVEDPGDGWPGRVRLRADPPLSLALHVGNIGFSHRDRDEVERRFQNPGQNRPLSDDGVAMPLLVGLWTERNQPVLVAMDASRRMDNLTRQSLFIRLSELVNAEQRGWSEYTNKTGENIYLFHPALFSAYVRLHAAENRATDFEVQDLIEASGLIDRTTTPEERVRRATSVLTRRAAFAAEVLEAYERLCAMCGLNLGLVEAAHIYPAHASGSLDIVNNGIALCRNHHGAFDQHRIWINPKSGDLKLHPDWVRTPRSNRVSRAFARTCLPKLQVPADVSDRPNPTFLRERYNYFGDSYAWARA